MAAIVIHVVCESLIALMYLLALFVALVVLVVVHVAVLVCLVVVFQDILSGAVELTYCSSVAVIAALVSIDFTALRKILACFKI